MGICGCIKNQYGYSLRKELLPESEELENNNEKKAAKKIIQAYRKYKIRKTKTEIKIDISEFSSNLGKIVSKVKLVNVY